MNIDRIFSLDRAAGETVQEFTIRRFAFDNLAVTDGRPFIALVGPRGAGKTVLLRQMRAQTPDSVYISADSLDPDIDLYELVRVLSSQFGIQRLFIDEIHFINGFAAHLKTIHDFLSVRMWFSSSVALALDQTRWDLSRRVMTYRVYPFTYREYLRFVEGIELDALSLETCLSGTIAPQYLRLGHRFHDYLRGGLHPFFLQPGAGLPLFENIVQTVINRDIPSVVPSVTVADLEKLSQLVRFIGRSAVDGINYSTLSRNLGITVYKAEQYLSWLERSFIATRVFPAGTNVLKEPKLLLQLPYRLLHQDFEQAIGALREEFFALAMQQHGCNFQYAKSVRGAKTPDFLLSVDAPGTLTGTVVEIGGRRKGRSQFKGLEYERKVVLFDREAKLPGQDGTTGRSTGGIEPGRRVPLFCIGFASR